MSSENSSAPQERAISMFTANEMIVSGGTFNLFAKVRAPNDHRRVIYESFKDYIVLNATHYVDDPTNPWPRCHPNTRTTTLAGLESRAQDQDKSSAIIWVSGGPGSSKSAITGSLCDILQAKGQLGASFTFRPGKYDSKRGFIATIACQLATSISDIQPHIAAALEEDPLILQQSPQIQMEKLITLPLLNCELDSPRFVVIDGLDKYGNINIQCCILSILGESAARLDGKLRFIGFSRFQPHIASTLESELFKPITTSINLDDDPTTRDDIRIVLKKEIGQIATLHGLSASSEEALIDLLISSGTSYYPNVALKYIEVAMTSCNSARRRLQILLLSIGFVVSSFVALDSFVDTILITEAGLFFF